MTREQIIETMARALCARIYPSPDFKPDGSQWPSAWERSRVEFHQQATAALSALEAAGMVVVPREPTDKMIDAAIMADRPPLRKITVGDVLKAEYTAMVKAALNPERDSSG
jgi:hypothetical protein